MERAPSAPRPRAIRPGRPAAASRTPGMQTLFPRPPGAVRRARSRAPRPDGPRGGPGTRTALRVALRMRRDVGTIAADLPAPMAALAASFRGADALRDLSTGSRFVHPSSLAVIGLGAIGGSLAWQARLAGVPRVVGFSPSRADGVQALRAGAITELADSAARAMRGAELVVLAVPAQVTLELIGRLRPALEAGAVLTDVCSVKAPVAGSRRRRRARRPVRRRPSAGGHPRLRLRRRPARPAPGVRGLRLRDRARREATRRRGGS